MSQENVLVGVQDLNKYVEKGKDPFEGYVTQQTFLLLSKDV